MPGYKIRPGIPNTDHEALTILSRDTADEVQGQFSSRRLGSELIPSPFDKSHVFVAQSEHDGQLVGFVIIRFTDLADTPQTHQSRRADVLMLGVSPAFRRQGIARDLMCAALALAEEMKATFITLCVANHNEAAIRLYESMGWIAIDRMMAFPGTRRVG